MERGNIGKDSLKLTVSQMVALLIGMVSAMLLSRFRTLAEYGTYSQLYIIAELIAPVIMLGLPEGISYFLARGTTAQDKKQVLSMHLISITLLGIFTGALLYIMKPFLIQYFSNPMLGSIIVVIAVFPLTRTINNSVQSILVVYNKTSWLLLFKISHSLLILAAVIITVILRLDFKIYMVLFISIESVFSIGVYLIVIKLSGKLLLYFNLQLMKKFLKYSIPMGLSVTLGSINKNVDKLIIGKFFSTENLAIYTNAARELPLNLVGVSIATALLPRIVILIKEKKSDKAFKLWGESIKLSYVFLCFFTTVLIVYAPEIISILYSPKYLPGVTVFRLYSILLLLNVTFFNMMLSSMGKTKYILYSAVISMVVNVVFSIVFYYLIGFIGPAIATILSAIIFKLSQLIITKKLAGIEFRHIFPWIILGKITLVNLAFGVCFFIVKSIVNFESSIGQIPESLIFGACWMVIYLGIYFKYIKRKWDILNKGGQGDNY